MVEFDFFFGITRHVPEDSTCFIFIFCYLSATLMLYSLQIFQRMQEAALSCLYTIYNHTRNLMYQ